MKDEIVRDEALIHGPSPQGLQSHITRVQVECTGIKLRPHKEQKYFNNMSYFADNGQANAIPSIC